MSGASLLVVHECSKHHGFVRLLPLKEAEAQAKSMKAKAASAGKRVQPDSDTNDTKIETTAETVA
jgi:hypothetical protein